MITSALVRVSLPVAWMMLIFALSSQQTFPGPSGLSAQLLPVVAHMLLFGVLGVLSFELARSWTGSVLVAALCAVTLATAYGVTDELHQSFVPGRDASLIDVCIDLIGASLAIVAWRSRSSIRRAIMSE
jgi:VanZ family protein